MSKSSTSTQADPGTDKEVVPGPNATGEVPEGPAATDAEGAAEQGADPPGQDAPTDDNPTDDAPAEEAPAEEAPAEEAPADEAAPEVTADGESSGDNGVSEHTVRPEDDVVLLEPEEDPRIGQMQTTIDELQARLRAVSAAFKNQQDDLAAARVRLERQAAIKEEMRRGEVVVALFDPVQNLRRSIDAVRKGASGEDTAQGLELVVQQFMDAFGNLGLEEVPGTGSRFDPNLHEALSLVPTPDPALDGVVLEVFSAGYRIGNRLVEPARVIVGQLIQPDPPAEDTSAEPDEEAEVIDISAVAGGEE